MSKPDYRISIDDIKADLKELANYWVVVFGSWVDNKLTSRSDVDIAIISQNKNMKNNKKLYFNLLGSAPEKYDLKLFELLPLYLQGSILENYVVIYGNTVDISYYLYGFRKLWVDEKIKIKKYEFKSIKERDEGRARLKRYKNRINMK